MPLPTNSRVGPENQNADREPGTRPDGEAAPPSTIDPLADDQTRPQADPETTAPSEWNKRRGPDPDTRDRFSSSLRGG